MVRLTSTHIVYDIYETCSSLNAAVKGGSINWKDTKHDPDSGEFTTTYTGGSSGGQVALPFTPGDVCPTCGHTTANE